jgi:16S rRNA (guanine(1405)-N(7))-methyltransferase
MDDLDKLVQAVLRSRKYGRVCADVVRNIGERELAKRRSWRGALKATKAKLHQVGAAYLGASMEYESWLERLQHAVDWGDGGAFRSVCVEAMSRHASTRERLGMLDRFYAQVWSELPQIASVLDVACGLNPLAISWMPLGEGVQYWAYDIFTDMVAFINGFFALAGVQGKAEARDVTHAPPQQRADLALILKSLPCIEQLDRSASPRLLETLNVGYLLVSFPTHSLGGRDKAMVRNYERRMWELVDGKPWDVRRFEFETELAFVVEK